MMRDADEGVRNSAHRILQTLATIVARRLKSTKRVRSTSKNRSKLRSVFLGLDQLRLGCLVVDSSQRVTAFNETAAVAIDGITSIDSGSATQRRLSLPTLAATVHPGWDGQFQWRNQSCVLVKTVQLLRNSSVVFLQVSSPVQYEKILWPLTARQKQIALCLVNSGDSYKELAGQLNISVGTMRSHVEKIYRKMGVRSRPELCALLLGTHSTEGA